MDSRVLLNLGGEVGQLMTCLSVLNSNLFYFNQAISDKNPEIVVYYYNKYQESFNAYIKASDVFKNQANKQLTGNRYLSTKS